MNEVLTPDGWGQVLRTQSAYGRTSYLVKGAGFEGWYDGLEVTADFADHPDDVVPNDDNETTLPYPSKPQGPGWDGTTSTIQPDIDPHLDMGHASDSLTGEDTSEDPVEADIEGLFEPHSRLSGVRAHRLHFAQSDDIPILDVHTIPEDSPVGLDNSPINPDNVSTDDLFDGDNGFDRQSSYDRLVIEDDLSFLRYATDEDDDKKEKKHQHEYGSGQSGFPRDDDDDDDSDDDKDSDDSDSDEDDSDSGDSDSDGDSGDSSGSHTASIALALSTTADLHFLANMCSCNESIPLHSKSEHRELVAEGKLKDRRKKNSPLGSKPLTGQHGEHNPKTPGEAGYDKAAHAVADLVTPKRKGRKKLKVEHPIKYADFDTPPAGTTPNGVEAQPRDLNSLHERYLEGQLFGQEPLDLVDHDQDDADAAGSYNHYASTQHHSDGYDKYIGGSDGHYYLIASGNGKLPKGEHYGHYDTYQDAHDAVEAIIARNHSRRSSVQHTAEEGEHDKYIGSNGDGTYHLIASGNGKLPKGKQYGHYDSLEDARHALRAIEQRNHALHISTAGEGGVHAPYKIEKRNGRYHVVNAKGESKEAKGYATEEEARQHQKALYANVPGAAEMAKHAAPAQDAQPTQIESQISQLMQFWAVDNNGWWHWTGDQGDLALLNQMQQQMAAVGAPSGPPGQMQTQSAFELEPNTPKPWREYLQTIASDRLVALAAWKDVVQKSKRLRSEGAIDVEAFRPDVITAYIQGDHGRYYTTVQRLGSIAPGVGRQLTSTQVSGWSCDCDWGHWAWLRKRSFVGRMCSHAYALFSEMRSLDAKARKTKGQPGRFASVGNKTSWTRTQSGGFDWVTSDLTLPTATIAKTASGWRAYVWSDGTSEDYLSLGTFGHSGQAQRAIARVVNAHVKLSDSGDVNLVDDNGGGTFDPYQDTGDNPYSEDGDPNYQIPSDQERGSTGIQSSSAALSGDDDEGPEEEDNGIEEEDDPDDEEALDEEIADDENDADDGSDDEDDSDDDDDGGHDEPHKRDDDDGTDNPGDESDDEHIEKESFFGRRSDVHTPDLTMEDGPHHDNEVPCDNCGHPGGDHDSEEPHGKCLHVGCNCPGWDDKDHPDTDPGDMGKYSATQLQRQYGLSYLAGADYSPAAQHRLVSEGENGPGARNKTNLNLEGTHYMANASAESPEDTLAFLF
jgi:hypothetical protein